MSTRDNFPKPVQADLVLRAALHCSNPGCRVLTKGPADLSQDVVSIGVACHIKAAAPGGPRFDADQTAAERASIENGIWLCANCSRLIDGEPSKYTVELLMDWKQGHEDAGRQAIGRRPWNRSALDVLVGVDLDQPRPGAWRNGDEAILTYESEHLGAALLIRPALPYIERFRTGDVIRPLSYRTPIHGPFLWSFPALDIKVLNNTARTVFLTEIVLEVSTSRPTPIPLLVIEADSQKRWGGHLKIVNEGDATISELSLNFWLVPPGTPVDDGSAHRKHKIIVGAVVSSVTVPLWEAFKADGIDVVGLERLAAGVDDGDGAISVKDSNGHDAILSTTEWEKQQRTYLGPFEGGQGTIVGTLDFSGASMIGGPTTVHSVRFEAPFRVFDENRSGVARAATFEYSTALRTTGAEYVVSRPISQELKAGETDRFSLRLAAPQSTQHIFTVSLRDISGEVVASQKVDLVMLVPRSSATRVGYQLSQAADVPEKQSTATDDTHR